MGSINSYAGPLIFNSKADRLWLMDLELSGVHDIARPRRITAHTRWRFDRPPVVDLGVWTPPLTDRWPVDTSAISSLRTSSTYLQPRWPARMAQCMTKISKQVAQLLRRMSRSYSVVWNSCAACWRWLFQTWIFWRFACSQYGFNLFVRWHRRLRFKLWGVWGDRDAVGG